VKLLLLFKISEIILIFLKRRRKSLHFSGVTTGKTFNNRSGIKLYRINNLAVNTPKELIDIKMIELGKSKYFVAASKISSFCQDSTTNFKSIWLILCQLTDFQEFALKSSSQSSPCLQNIANTLRACIQFEART